MTRPPTSRPSQPRVRRARSRVAAARFPLRPLRWLPLIALLAFGPAALAAPDAPQAGQGTSDPFVSFDRVRTLLENPDGPAGDLPLQCTVRLQATPSDTGAGGRTELPIEILLDLRGLEAPPDRLRVTLAAATIEGELATFQETVTPDFALAAAGTGTGTAAGAPEQAPEMWLYRGHVELADEVQGAAAVVEAVDAGRWGGCYARLTDSPLAPPAGLRVAIYDPAAGEPGSAAGPGSTRRGTAVASGPTRSAGSTESAGSTGAGAGTATEPETTETPEEAAERAVRLPPRPGRQRSRLRAPERVPAELASDGGLIVLLPPKDRPARGRTEIDTMVTSELVRSAVFYLDGKEAATDERPPFSTTLDLGDTVAPHTIRVVARDRSGTPMGEHQITLNRRSAPFDVAITGVHPVHSHRPAALPGQGDFIQVDARVEVPPDKTLDRVEFYENETLVDTVRQPPWTARLPASRGGEPDPAAYVRVLAVLADGDSLEDVRLLSAGTPSERVEVNLVQLFAVVTNPDGAAVEGLGPDDFQVTVGGERRKVERFQVADDVPLTLGLLIDTSGSMDTLMLDAKQAAGRFLLQTLIRGDQAFLVDFADRPKLLQAPTGDTSALLGSFSRLLAGGATALYDAIVYSVAQIQETTGRRALVLVTDGFDEGSRFTTRRAIHDARRLAVPIYVISLAGLYNERGTVHRSDLEAITEHTGGRVYYIHDKGELTAAYDEINRELRSQYVLAFGTERFLTEDELSKVKLDVARKGLDVRWTAGSGQ